MKKITIALATIFLLAGLQMSSFAQTPPAPTTINSETTMDKDADTAKVEKKRAGKHRKMKKEKRR